MLTWGYLTLTYEQDAGSSYNRIRYIHQAWITYPVAFTTNHVQGFATGVGAYPCSGLCFANPEQTKCQIKMGTDTSTSYYHCHWLCIGY